MARKRRTGESHRWVLAACVLAHVVLIGWLAQRRGFAPTADTSLQVIFVEPAARDAPAPLPPFPRAPQRPRRPEKPMRSADPHPASSDSAPAVSAPAADALLSAPVSTMRLLEAIPGAARQAVGEFSVPVRDPTRRYVAPLPGRAEPFTPEAIALRRQVTPEDVVKTVGAFLFGANYDACLDSRMKIRDLAARNERIGDDELRVLIDRERRRCP